MAAKANAKKTEQDVDVAAKPDNREPRHQPEPAVQGVEDEPNLKDLEEAEEARSEETVDPDEEPAPVLDDGSEVFEFPNGDVVVVGPPTFKV